MLLGKHCNLLGRPLVAFPGFAVRNGGSHETRSTSVPISTLLGFSELLLGCDEDDLTRQADQIRVSVVPGLTRPPGDGKTFHGFHGVDHFEAAPGAFPRRQRMPQNMGADQNVAILHDRPSRGSLFVSSPIFEMKHSIPHQWHRKSHHRRTRLGSEKLLSSDSRLDAASCQGHDPSDEPGAGETAPQRKETEKEPGSPATTKTVTTRSSTSSVSRNRTRLHARQQHGHHAKCYGAALTDRPPTNRR